MTEPTTDDLSDLDQLVLGESARLLRFDSRGPNRDIATALARQARQGIDILTPDLELPVYDSPGFLEAVRQLAIRSRSTRVRVLIGDSTPAVKNGHRLIELARHFTSSVFVHNPSRQHRDFGHADLMVDGVGYLHKHISSRYEGEANFRDPLRCRELLREFDSLWELSQPDPEMRRLHI